MKHLPPYRQNETSLSPLRGRGMVYGGGMMSENSTEIFQVEVHQTCIIVLVFLCKETEFVTLVEPVAVVSASTVTKRQPVRFP